jgi:hypothetical protein
MENGTETTDIIIVGYPKSGNTWITRLVAELVGCPVVGFLNSDHHEIAREGLERESNFRCYKSHHQAYELDEIDIKSKKIIYVLRDPRDICLSGSAYFVIERWPFLGRLFSDYPKMYRIYKGINKLIISRSKYRIKRMAEAIIYGSREVHWWVRVSWAAHYKPYLEKNTFFVKYEDLLSNTKEECERIIDFLGIQRTDAQINAAIEKQSFKNKKKEFLKKGQQKKANFLRTGRKEQWREGLPLQQKKMFEEMLNTELIQFGYPTEKE